ncbi:uncharacterized protein EI90DRAFT_3071396 [Cantharellus anzutake]|uniref:uncharacterized protein n=1 Tax=Cantharellus anzutake TaxID=1750568 RepID=UPI001906E2E0|nr:uncharacterized protein EI90DRAFT_3071396 [Cantharellus anzutake]KAF8326067.1 hypothetical protein EI90DRAFT_3071396 [Cantharellus anzutake]
MSSLSPPLDSASATNIVLTTDHSHSSTTTNSTVCSPCPSPPPAPISTMQTIHPFLLEQHIRYSQELAEYSSRQLVVAQQEHAIAEARRRQAQAGAQAQNQSREQSRTPPSRQRQRWNGGGSNMGGEGVVGRVGRAIVRAVDFSGGHGNGHRERSSNNDPADNSRP